MGNVDLNCSVDYLSPTVRRVSKWGDSASRWTMEISVFLNPASRRKRPLSTSENPSHKSGTNRTLSIGGRSCTVLRAGPGTHLAGSTVTNAEANSLPLETTKSNPFQLQGNPPKKVCFE